MHIAVASLIAFLGFHLILLLHELGHYFAARMFNLAVPSFVVGLGPTLLGFRRGATWFAWKPVPIIGFVHILGIIGPNDPGINAAKDRLDALLWIRENNLPPEVDVIIVDQFIHQAQVVLDPNRHYYSLSWWKQIIVMIAGPAMHLVAMLLFMASAMIMERINPTFFHYSGFVIREPEARFEQAGVVKLGDDFHVYARYIGGRKTFSPEAVKVMARWRDKQRQLLPINISTLRTVQQSVFWADISSPCQAWPSSKVVSGLRYCMPEIAHPNANLDELWVVDTYRTALWLLANASILIGLMNLLPVPPLDGGRIVFSLLVAVGAPIPEKRVLQITKIGLFLLVLWQAENIVEILLFLLRR